MTDRPADRDDAPPDPPRHAAPGEQGPPGIVGPIDSIQTPRFAGAATFARLPTAESVAREPDVVVVGIPFDAGTTYRPGARFGPQAIRQGSRLLRPYHPGLDVYPFAAQQVVDAGDMGVTPFSIDDAIRAIEEQADDLSRTGARILALGGDHTISLPLLRSLNRRHGPVAVVHFDAHLDTWETYFGAPYTHGTTFRRAAEEGLFLQGRSTHAGIRGPLYGAQDLQDDQDLGFHILDCMTIAEAGAATIADRIVERAAGAPIYLSIDIDVLDPAFAPGTGTPEAGGLSSRELLATLRALRGSRILGADIVEVSPAYDHAEVTTVAAAHVAYEILALMALDRPRD